MKKYQGGKIAVSDQDKHNFYIKQEFKGQTLDEPTVFPRGLGAKHPFDFEDLEKLFKKDGMVSEAVAKIANAIVTDFEIKVDNENSQAIIDDFVHDTNFHTVVEAWVREAVLKGNGFIEIDLEDSRIRVLNANAMFVRRNKKGKILEYNQWTRPFKNFTKESTDLVTFKPNEIAHLPINKIPNDPYGIGLIYPNERIIENLIQNEQDLQIITERKAGSPYHIKVGQAGVVIPQNIVDDIKGKLQFLTKTHEWVTDGDVEIKSIPFEGLGKNITEAQNYFLKKFIAGLGVPEVLFGSGQLNEGIAKTQMEGWKRKIAGYQKQIGQIIEEKVIRPLLKAHDLDEVPDFIWDLPTEEDIEKRLVTIQASLSSLMTSPMMRAQLEIEQAKLLGFEQLADELPTPEEAQEAAEKKEQEEREREQEAQIPQPEVPGAKPRANQKMIKEVVRKQGSKWCVFSETGKNLGCFSSKAGAQKRLAQIEFFKKRGQSMDSAQRIEEGLVTVKEFVNLKEISGFNYTDYLVKILAVLRTDTFTDLKAVTKEDITAGLLVEKEIEKLRQTLRDGFRNNLTIKQIENNIRTNVRLIDRKTKRGVIAATNRPNMIARTETVRVANEGLLNLYRENRIEKVRFLAALSGRTCPICEDLNGQVFTINESSGIIPVHTSCRCSWISVITG